MKKLILLLLVSVAFAQQTPNIHLNIPALHTNGWDVLLNSNFTALDNYLSGQSTIPALVTNSLSLTGNGSTTGSWTVGGALNVPLLLPSANVCTDPSRNLTTSGCALGGTVTTLGDFPPLFTVINPTTTPSFQASAFAAHTFYGNNTGGSAVPGAQAIGTGDLPFTYTGNTALIPTVGTYSGATGALLCKDASGNITTTGCSTAGGGAIVGSPGGGVSQTVAQAVSTNLFVNRFEGDKYCDGFGSLQLCHDDLPATGGIMHLPPGTTNVCSLAISKPNVHMVGTGEESTVLACATASAPVITITGDQPFFEDFTVKHITNQPTCPGGDGTATCGDGIQFLGTSSVDRPTFRHVKANFNYNGFALGPVSKGTTIDVLSERNQNHGFVYLFSASRVVMQWSHSNTYSLQNLNDGFHLANTTGVQQTCPQWVATTAYGNGQYGWNVTASSPSGIGVCWFNGVNASTNNNSGIRLDTGAGARSHNIAGFCFSELSGELNDGGAGGTGVVVGWNTTPTNSGVGHGIEITANNDLGGAPNINVSSCVLANNAWSGISVLTNNVTLTGITTFSNGHAVAGSGKQAGLAIGANNTTVSGGTELDSGSITETAGIEIFNSADKPSITGFACNANVTNCLLQTTAPANGYIQNIGRVQWIQKAGAASGSCTNGSFYTNITAGNVTPVLSVCKNSAWVTVN